MRPFKLPIFNEIDLDDLENWYDAQVEVDGDKVSMDMNFDETTANETEVAFVKEYLEKLPETSRLLKGRVQTDAAGTVVGEYVNRVTENVSEEKLNELLSKADQSLPQHEQLLSFLRLKRVAFFPEDAERFAFFDYTIGVDFTDFLLAFTLDTKGEVVELSIENY